ncbi:hypothetical protein A2U01_0106319, partial [Trifolium medium]|nr:hypothetical protein [Trifolium medium]
MRIAKRRARAREKEGSSWDLGGLELEDSSSNR